MSEQVTTQGATYTAPDARTVGSRLVALCREGNNEAAIRELYADDIVSWEVQEPMRETRGKENVLGKLFWWNGAHEIHAATTEGPFANGDEFAVRFHYDITQRETGKRFTMEEIGVYRVRDGRIVEERFFY